MKTSLVFLHIDRNSSFTNFQNHFTNLIGTVQDTENRPARMDFKIAVELSKLCHVIAYTYNVDENALNKLHLKCLDEVRRINGAVDFEGAYKYQKRET